MEGVTNNSELSLPATVTTSDFPLEEINKQLSDHDNIVKQEDPCTMMIQIQVKSEPPNVKYKIIDEGDEIKIKPVNLVNQIVLHIKDERVEEKDSLKHCYYFIPNDKFTTENGGSESTKNNCELCNHICLHNYTVVKYVNSHSRDNIYQCPVCTFKTKVYSNLERHMQKHLLEEKPFKCNLCEYKCNRKNNLVQHMKIHIGNKRFRCNLCTYKCLRKGDLLRHVEAHSEEKPFECKICKSTFKLKKRLVFHMYTHTKEKPLKCTICDYKCIKRCSLQRHIMKTHPN